MQIWLSTCYRKINNEDCVFKINHVLHLNMPNPVVVCLIILPLYAVILCPTESIRRVRDLSGENIVFYKVDLLDKPALQEVFTKVSHKFAVYSLITRSTCIIQHGQLAFKWGIIHFGKGTVFLVINWSYHMAYYISCTCRAHNSWIICLNSVTFMTGRTLRKH